MANLQKRGKVYWADLRVDGRRIRQSLKTGDKRVATEKLAKLELDLLRRSDGVLNNHQRLETILQRWIDDCADGWRATTAQRNGQHVANVLRNTPAGIYVDQLNTRTVAEWRRSRFKENGRGKKPISRQSVFKDENAMRIALNWAVREKLIESNPLMDIPKIDFEQEERRPLTKDEIRSLLAASNEPYRTVWEFLLITGMRKEEVCGFQFKDITSDGKILIRGADAKGKTRRHIPLSKRANEIVESQRQDANGRDLVFVTGKGTKLGVNLWREFDSARERAGIVKETADGKIDIHALRTTCTTLLFQAGVDPKTVQAWMGHKSLETTMRHYAKATDNSLREAADAISF